MEDGEDGERPAFLLVKDSEAEARTWYQQFKPFVWDAGSENLEVKVFERFGGLWCFGFDALPKGVLPKGGSAHGCDQSKLLVKTPPISFRSDEEYREDKGTY